MRGVKDAAHAIEELGGRFSKYFGPGSIVAGAVVGMVEFVREQVKWAGELKDVAEKLDTTTRKVQGLKYAAAATRTPFEEFEGWTRFKVSKWRCAIRYGIYMARQKRAQEAERIDRRRNPHRYCTRPDLN